MNVAELRALDTTTVPVEDIPRICYHAATTAATLKRMLGDCEDVVKELSKRADTTLLKDLEKADTEYGSYKRMTRTNMVLPPAELGGKDVVLQHVVDQVNDGMPVDEAFAILSTSLKKTAFDDMEDAELPLGIKRSDQTSVKFTPKKNVTL